MRKTFKMTEEEVNALKEASKPTPAMWLSGGQPMFDSPQENANRFWKALGEKYGFVWDSAGPSDEGPEYFTADAIAEN